MASWKRSPNPVNSGRLVSVSVCKAGMSCASCITTGMKLCCPFSCSDGTRRHCPPQNLSKVRAGEGRVSFPPTRVPPGCSDAEILDFCRRSASLIAFNSLQKAKQHTLSLQYFSQDVPQKKAIPIQRAELGMCSRSKGKKTYLFLTVYLWEEYWTYQFDSCTWGLTGRWFDSNANDSDFPSSFHLGNE